MARTDRMAHHEYTITGKRGLYLLSVADVGDDYWSLPGPVAEAAVQTPDGDWSTVWRGPHRDAVDTFILLKEALKARIHPDRWIAVVNGELVHE